MSDLVRAGSLGKGGLGGVGRQTKVERPRPLKMSGGREPELRHEDLLVLLESVSSNFLFFKTWINDLLIMINSCFWLNMQS